MGARSSSVQLASALSSVPVGRHFVRDLLLGWGLAPAVDDASLAVTELIANAVKHARSPVVVRVVVDADILVSVHDRSPQLRRRPGRPDPLAENGRGLRIVAAVSADWGITDETGGKCLWFRLPMPDRASADADVIRLHGGAPSRAGAQETTEQIGGAGLSGRAVAS